MTNLKGASDDSPIDSVALLRDVTVFYGEVVGLSRVTLGLGPGITGLVGPNGSGKTTLMRVLTGLILPREGKTTVFGEEPFFSAAVRSKITLVPAVEAFYENVSGLKNLEIAFLARGCSVSEAKTNAASALELVGLTADGARKVETWSRGMRQRLKLGLALVADAGVVLLDEPFLGVDPPNRQRLRQHIEWLGNHGRTVLITSHVLHEIESLTDRVGILAHGRLLGMGHIGSLLSQLRDRYPHRIELEVDNARKLAKALIGLPHVRELKVAGDHVLELLTESPDQAYRDLATVVLSSGALIYRVVARDNSLEALFSHVTAAGAQRL
ncbi:MAG: ABC transporter ATP-binding protein [Myxococcales bacterium]|nr:ABC transporter ATP-binding protein [Myxococcales bacterium]